MSAFSKFSNPTNKEKEPLNAQIPEITELKKESDLLAEAMKQVNKCNNIKPFKSLCLISAST